MQCLGHTYAIELLVVDLKFDVTMNRRAGFLFADAGSAALGQRAGTAEV